MAHLGLNVHELIDAGDRLDAQHGAAILGGTDRLRLSKPQKRGSDDGRKRWSAPPRERPCESSMSHNG